MNDHVRFKCSEREFKAIKLYEGGVDFKEKDEFYLQKSAYRTLNLLMMEGHEGEWVRVCVERQRPNSLYIHRWSQTVEVLTDIFTVQCRYSNYCACLGRSLPHPLIRGERGVNFRMMEASGGTFAFTSTTEGELLDSFIRGKQNPHVLHISIGDGVPYLDFKDVLGEKYHFINQREILFPPMVKMICSPGVVIQHKGIGPVHHYDIRFTGIVTDIETQNEKELIASLNTYSKEAAGGLDDLIQNGSGAAIFCDSEHPYWIWKSAFRHLTIQRMREIYNEYYGK